MMNMKINVKQHNLTSMKKCNGPCKQLKELSEFRKAKSCRDGLRGECKDCSKLYGKSHYLKNKDKYLQSASKSQQNNKEYRKEYMKNYTIENTKILQKKRRKYYLDNKEEILYKIKKNRHKYVKNKRADTAKRRALKLNATFSGFDKEIREIYENCPEGYHVDHMMPLNHPRMCGLHVPWNLQYLTAEDNIAKSNKLNWSKDGN